MSKAPKSTVARELKDTPNTLAKFTQEELSSFIHFGHERAIYTRANYLQKVASRQPNPRLDDRGREVLSQISVCIDADDEPITAKQHHARFIRQGSVLDGENGFDSDDSMDSGFESSDRMDLVPSRHELRVQKVEKAVKAHREELQRKKEEGDTPLPDKSPKAAENKPEAKSEGPKQPTKD